MRTLTEIQTGAKNVGRKDSIDLTTAGSDGLATSSRMYRAMSSRFPFPEFSQRDESIVTKAKRGIYDWPGDPRFLNVKSIAMQDASDLDFYKLISPARAEFLWQEMEGRPEVPVPFQYQRYAYGVVQKIEFRPAPIDTGQIVRISGVIESTDFVGGDSLTVFLQDSADDALEHLIAADIADVDGNVGLSQQLTRKAFAILSVMFGKEVVTMENVAALITG